MVRASVYIAISLDGYISRPDGSIDWLHRVNRQVPEGEDLGYYHFIDTVDCLIMGRSTFEQVLTFSAWPYGGKQVVVMSRRGVDVPAALKNRVSVSGESPEQLLQRLGREGVRHVYVDGGALIHSFLAAGLIDEMIITTVPVLLGAGKPLFGALPADLSVQHVSTQAYDFGFVQSTWRIARA
jgi:dihydrofolate reductase